MATGPMRFGAVNDAGDPNTPPNQTVLRAQIPNIATLVVAGQAEA
jgi:hypothetical protein